MPVEHEGWMRRSRFLGAMRYHRAWMGRLIGWGLLVLLAGNAIAIAAALAGAGDLNMAGVSSDFSLTMALLLVCACLAAHSRTRFLLRFGTARFPVWLSNVLALFLGAAAFLMGTLLINLATGGTVLLLSRTMPARFTLTAYTDALPTGAALLGHTLRESLEGLPQQLLWLLEWTCLFYLLACCLRRGRGLTLAVVLGVPFVCVMLMLMPFVRETAVILESGTETEILAMGLEWMQWLARVAQFVVEQWQWIQLGAAAVSLPLSYLCMRTTPQP